MLPSFRDQGPGRSRRRNYSHGSIYGSHKTARASKVSIVSVLTVQSNGSNGSNSTVTQESYNKATRRRRTSSSKQRKGEPLAQRRVMPGLQEAASKDYNLNEGEAPTEDIDVFAFLVDETTGAGTEHLHADPDLEEDEPPPVPYPDDATQERDFHSDSGISIADTLASLGRSQEPGHLPAIAEYRDHCQHDEQRPCPEYPRVPRPSYRPPDVGHVFVSDVQNEQQGDTPSADAGTVRWTKNSNPQHESVVECIDQLAVKYTVMDKPPLFKAFKETKFRILLHLQDEIMRLEDELTSFNAYTETCRREGSLGAGWSHCEIDIDQARVAILDKLHLRMEQYYETIDRLRKWRAVPNVSARDIDVFRREIVGSRQEPDLMATGDLLRFLDDPTDLFQATGPFPPPHGSAGTLAALSAMSVALPLVLMKLYSGVMGRISVTERLSIVGLTLAVFLLVSKDGFLNKGLSGSQNVISKRSTCSTMVLGALSALLISFVESS